MFQRLLVNSTDILVVEIKRLRKTPEVPTDQMNMDREITAQHHQKIEESEECKASLS